METISTRFRARAAARRNVVAAFRGWARLATRERSDGIRGGARRVGDARRGGASRGASRETRRAIVRARVARRDDRATRRARFAEDTAKRDSKLFSSVATSRRRRRERARASRARRGSSLARRGCDGDAPSGRRRTRGDARGDATIDARVSALARRDGAPRRRRRETTRGVGGGVRPDARRRGGVPRTRRRGGSRGGGGGVVAREGDARRVGVGGAGRVRRRAARRFAPRIPARVAFARDGERRVRSRARRVHVAPRPDPTRVSSRRRSGRVQTRRRRRASIRGGRRRDLRRRVRVDGGGDASSGDARRGRSLEGIRVDARTDRAVDAARSW